jgi:putative transposase
VNSSWRVDETYIKIRGKWSFLYRVVVDKHGETVDFLLRPDRSVAAQAFFRKSAKRSRGVYHGGRARRCP